MLYFSAQGIFGRELDCKLAFYCAPVIAGIKLAGILSIKKPTPFSLHRSLARLARPLGDKGVFFLRLAECDKRVLLIIYNRELLLERLRGPENSRLLEHYGYQIGWTLGSMLTRLAMRIRANNGFPHEIGVFLGYPTSDVERFIQKRGQDFKLCGYWKVYSNVEEAKRIFSVYDRARNHFCQKVADGEEIYNITYGGTAV